MNLTFDANVQKARIQAEKEARLAQEIRALYVPNDVPPAEAAAINAAIEADLAALKAKCQSLAHGEKAETPVIDED